MKFKFNLETLRKHRKVVEDIAQRDFSLAQFEYNEAVAKKEQMIESIHQARNQITNGLKNKDLGTEYLRQIEAFIKGTEVKVQRQTQVILQKEKKVEEQREILRLKAIDYKIIDKLRDNKKAEFNSEMKKKEQILVDELVTMRFQKGK